MNKLITLISLSICLVSTIPNSFAQKFDQTNVKASFITRFINFTRWPQSQNSTSSSQFNICIAGNDPYSDILKHYPKKGIHGRALHVERLNIDMDKTIAIARLVKQCHVLVVLFDDLEKNNQLLSLVAKFPVLTISENTTSREQLSMINMVNKNEAIAFSINREKATLAGIEFSSRLLKHADKIVGGGQ